MIYQDLTKTECYIDIMQHLINVAFRGQLEELGFDVTDPSQWDVMDYIVWHSLEKHEKKMIARCVISEHYAL